MRRPAPHFLLSSALEHIRSVVDLYEKRPNSKLLIVGHTDVTGEPSVNDPLSLNRAKSIKAYLTDDVETWLDFYEDHMHPKARWGSPEDHLMLNAILEATAENLTDTPVRHFQTTRNLAVDGKIGEETRRALIAEYMAADGTTLPSSIDPVIHGCGENFSIVLTGATKLGHARDRRVELFFFDGDLGILPPLPGEQSPPPAPEYSEWRRRSEETHEFHVRHENTVELLFVDETGAAIADAKYRVILSDGEVVEGVSDAAGRGRIPAGFLGEVHLEVELDATSEVLLHSAMVCGASTRSVHREAGHLHPTRALRRSTGIDAHAGARGDRP